MEVKYTTTLDDYVAFATYKYRHSRIRFIAVVFCLLSAIPFFLLGIAYAFQGLLPLALIAFVGTAGLIAILPASDNVLYPILVRIHAGSVGLRGVIGPITLILTDELLVEITETTRSEIKWKEMVRVDEVGNYTFIMVTPMLAVIVPRHGFEHESDYLKVCDFAKSRVGRRE
jgi:hypothetical protein